MRYMQTCWFGAVCVQLSWTDESLVKSLLRCQQGAFEGEGGGGAASLLAYLAQHECAVSNRLPSNAGTPPTHLTESFLPTEAAEEEEVLPPGGRSHRPHHPHHHNCCFSKKMRLATEVRIHDTAAY